MKKTILAMTFLAFSLFANTKISFAAPTFEGFSASLGLGVVGSNSPFKETGYGENADDGIDTDADIGKTKAIGRIDANYLIKSMNSNFLIGLGITYDLNSIKYKANTLGDDAYNSESGDSPVNVKLNKHYSIYLQPTYVIREGTAVFGKIGYHHVNASFQDTYNTHYRGEEPTKFKLSGYGLGLGLQTFVTDNAFIKVEGNYIRYNNKSFITPQEDYIVDFKTNQSEAIISVGYKF
jgi:opacity protein-like surface antigen